MRDVRERPLRGHLTSPAEFRQRVHFGLVSSHYERGGDEISGEGRVRMATHGTRSNEAFYMHGLMR